MNAAAPSRHLFPFTALTGQPLMRRALLANALCPDIGGVLLRGQKGTAKSTAVRALAKLLPSVSVVANCPWRCSPQGPLCPDCARAAARGPLACGCRMRSPDKLPLSATEDRLTGGLDTEAALRGGRRVVQPGLLAAAHQGMLYVDEINLLPDHLVDLLLDVCSSGVKQAGTRRLYCWTCRLFCPDREHESRRRPPASATTGPFRAVRGCAGPGRSVPETGNPAAERSL